MAIALLAVGCSSNPVVLGAPPVVSASASVPVSATGTFTEAEFANLVRDKAKSFAGVPDDLINSTARGVCGVFTPSQGGNATTLWRGLIDALVSKTRTTPEDAGRFVVFSVGQYCPAEYMYLPRP